MCSNFLGRFSIHGFILNLWSDLLQGIPPSIRPAKFQQCNHGATRQLFVNTLCSCQIAVEQEMTV